jgi:hypothetical protein
LIPACDEEQDMTRRRWLRAAFACLLLLGNSILIWYVTRPPEFEGKRLEAWLESLDDPDPAVRLKSVEGVRQLALWRENRDTERSLETLTRVALHDPDEEIRKKAREAVERYCYWSGSRKRLVTERKRKAVTTVLAALKDPNPMTRASAAELLAQLLDLQLPDALKHKDDPLNRELETPALKALVAALPDKDLRVRRTILQILKNVWHPVPFDEEKCLQAAQGVDAGMRRKIVELMAFSGPLSAKAIPLWLRVVEEGSRKNTGYPIPQFRPEAVPQLLDLIKADPKGAFAAEQALEQIARTPDEGKGRAAVAQGLKYNDPAVRQRVAYILWKVDSNRLKPENNE